MIDLRKIRWRRSPLERCFNIDDLRRLARRRLPAPVFDYLEGGADDEWSLANNRRAFERWQLLPRSLRDVSRIDSSTRILGQQVAWPVLMSPTGFSRMFHREGELAAARAAAAAGIFYSLSTFSSYRLEEVAAASDGPKLFQLYLSEQREHSDRLIERAQAAGYHVLCLTVDTPVGGNRERDLRMGLPPLGRLSLRAAAGVLAHPRWLYYFLRERPLPAANFFDYPPSLPEMQRVGPAKSLCWDDLLRIRDRWQGPLALKGIMSVQDAARAVEAGVTALIISNHGGRQLESTPAPVELVEEFVAAVGDRAEIIVDGGVRRGTHVLKSLALGASACMIGRPYLYGLAAAGEAGVARVLHLLREELVRNMRLLGTASIEDITQGHVRPRPAESALEDRSLRRERLSLVEP